MLWKPWVALKVLDRGKRGDSPREIAARGVYKVMTEKIISRGKCSELPATLWSNLSVETTHLSRGSYSTGHSHGRKPLVRGLPMFSEI